MPKKPLLRKQSKPKTDEKQESETEKKPPTMVTQVVEVIEITEPEVDQKTDKDDATEQATAQAAPKKIPFPPKQTEEEEEPKPEEQPEKSAKTPLPEREQQVKQDEDNDVNLEEVSEEEAQPVASTQSTPSVTSDNGKTPEMGKQKQVVEELFSKRNGDDLTELSVSDKKKRNPMFLWAAIVIVAALTTGIGLVLFSGKQPASIAIFPSKPTPTPTPAPTPTPTPLPELKREDITVQVLNGGGVAGAAGKMKTFLTDKGYQVTDLGNTDEYTYKETEILVKADKAQALTLLKDDLKGDYTLGTASATLPDDVSYDARVIVGAE